MADVLKVGIFGSIAMIVLAYLILRAEDVSLFAPEGERVDVAFDSVAGLDDKAPVRVAGVRVGRVDGISLEGGRARVRLFLDTPLELTTAASASIANVGLLGDKYVELDPGIGRGGPLPPGTLLEGRTPTSIDEVMARLDGLGSTLQNAAGQLTEGEGAGSLGRLVQNLEEMSAELRDLVVANRANVDATSASLAAAAGALAESLPRVASHLDELLVEVRGVVAENRGALGDGIENVRDLTARVQTSVDNLNEITGSLARGEGSLGKLLRSDEAHDELVATLASVQEGVEGLSASLDLARRLQVTVGLQGVWLEGPGESRSEFRLDLDPQSGKRYRLGVVDDPRGDRRTTTETVTVTDATGTTTQLIETVRVYDRTTFTALFGFPFGARGRVWTGLIENDFGVQLDYRPRPRLELALEAFDFSGDDVRDPHLRFTAGWALTPSLTLLGGYDDPLNSEQDSFFLGGRLSWRDDDLKSLLGVASSAL